MKNRKSAFSGKLLIATACAATLAAGIIAPVSAYSNTYVAAPNNIKSTSLDGFDNFFKAIQLDNNYLVLGAHEGKATVSILSKEGNITWMDETEENATYDDAFIMSNGNVMLFGHTDDGAFAQILNPKSSSEKFVVKTITVNTNFERYAPVAESPDGSTIAVVAEKDSDYRSLLLRTENGLPAYFDSYQLGIDNKVINSFIFDESYVIVTGSNAHLFQSDDDPTYALVANDDLYGHVLFNDAILSKDGKTIYIAGSTLSTSSQNNAAVFKLDIATMKITKLAEFTGDSLSTFYGITETENSNLILVGESHSKTLVGIEGSSDSNGGALIVEVSKDGKVVKSATWDGNGYDSFRSVFTTTNGVVVFGGSTSEDIDGLTPKSLDGVFISFATAVKANVKFNLDADDAPEGVELPKDGEYTWQNDKTDLPTADSLSTDDYTFDGWYTDKNFKQAYDGKTPSADLELYGRWIKNELPQADTETTDEAEDIKNPDTFAINPMVLAAIIAGTSMAGIVLTAILKRR